MIRITKFMNPDEYIWYNKRKITILEWIEKEKRRIEKDTGKKTYVKTLNGRMAIYRERIK